MYKVYEIFPGDCYTGYALIAANSAAEANERIASFKELDSDNRCDSYGWCYVAESDMIEYLSASCEGIIHNTIRYTG